MKIAFWLIQLDTKAEWGCDIILNLAFNPREREAKSLEYTFKPILH